MSNRRNRKPVKHDIDEEDKPNADDDCYEEREVPGPQPEIVAPTAVVYPNWIGPVSFLATVAVSIVFVPAAWAFILGFAVFVAVEAGLDKYRSSWYRPTTIIDPVATKAHTAFDNIGTFFGAAFDVAWWLDVLWTFLRRILPLDALWTATVELITVLFKMVSSPIALLVGFARRLVQSRTPVLSITLLLASIFLVATCIVQQKMPWQVVFYFPK